jgi:hypothetical protein
MSKQQRRFILLGTGITPSFAKEAKGQPTGARHYVGGIVFVMASMLFCFYWCGFPLSNIYFTDGYTRFGTPPSPNNWESSRYTWLYWCVWLVTLNLLLPYLLSAALLNNTVPEYAKFHYWISFVFIWLNIINWIMLSIIWLFFCNGSGTYGNSACNSIYWCCVYFAASPTASQWCPNVGPCIPDVTSLARNDEFFQAWLFAALFILWSWGHRKVARDLSEHGCFVESKE